MLRSLILVGIACAGMAHAEVPRVVTDIAPTQSLVAMVMGDLGDPTQILPANASPHSYALRPSQARSLSDADMVIWIGPVLTPWLHRSIETLSTDAELLELIEVEGVQILPARFGHDHDHGHEEEGHGDHDDEAEHDDHEEHVEDGADPHLWLNPDNAIVWLDAIADALSRFDPENENTYKSNAKNAAELVQAELSGYRQNLGHPKFVTYHDAYQYFEVWSAATSLGTLSQSDATDPSAADMLALRATLADANVACLITEPGAKSQIVETLGNDLRVEVLDPLGADLEQGSGLYVSLIRQMAEVLNGCK